MVELGVVRCFVSRFRGDEGILLTFHSSDCWFDMEGAMESA